MKAFIVCLCLALLASLTAVTFLARKCNQLGQTAQSAEDQLSEKRLEIQKICDEYRATNQALFGIETIELPDNLYEWYEKEQNNNYLKFDPLIPDVEQFSGHSFCCRTIYEPGGQELKKNPTALHQRMRTLAHSLIKRVEEKLAEKGYCHQTHIFGSSNLPSNIEAFASTTLVLSGAQLTISVSPVVSFTPSDEDVMVYRLELKVFWGVSVPRIIQMAQ